MRELTELTATELDMVTGGAGVAAAGSGTTSGNAAAGANQGVVQQDGFIFVQPGATLNAGGTGGATATGLFSNVAVANGH